MKFSNDVDLLKWEPVLFRELALPGQMLCRGEDGVTSGSTFSSASGLFVDAGVTAGQVIWLQDVEGVIDGCYEVVSVESNTGMTVSVVRTSSDDAAIAPPAATGISYRISTFDPQAEEAGFGLLQYFGLTSDASGDDSSTESVVNERALRQASVFAVLSAVFAGSSVSGAKTDGYWEKSLRYQKLFYEVRSRARLGIDVDGDDEVDCVRTGGVVRLQRG